MHATSRACARRWTTARRCGAATRLACVVCEIFLSRSNARRTTRGFCFLKAASRAFCSRLSARWMNAFACHAFAHAFLLARFWPRAAVWRPRFFSFFHASPLRSLKPTMLLVVLCFVAVAAGACDFQDQFDLLKNALTPTGFEDATVVAVPALACPSDGQLSVTTSITITEGANILGVNVAYSCNSLGQLNALYAKSLFFVVLFFTPPSAKSPRARTPASFPNLRSICRCSAV